MASRMTSKEMEDRRTRAIFLISEKGYSALGVSRQSAYKWKARHDEESSSGILAVSRPGRPSYLTKKQVFRLENILLKGPTESGFDNELWTCRRISSVIEKQFGVSYHSRGHLIN